MAVEMPCFEKALGAMGAPLLGPPLTQVRQVSLEHQLECELELAVEALDITNTGNRAAARRSAAARPRARTLA